MMDDVRILKGYSKTERKELEYTKKNMSWNNLLHNITYFPANTECGSIKDKYDEADTDKRISIIKDILDFYTDRAKFPEQKYYVQLIKDKNGSYLKRDMLRNFCTTGGCQPDSIQFQTQFTAQEIEDIDPRYMAFAVPVEEN